MDGHPQKAARIRGSLGETKNRSLSLTHGKAKGGRSAHGLVHRRTQRRCESLWILPQRASGMESRHIHRFEKAPNAPAGLAEALSSPKSLSKDQKKWRLLQMRARQDFTEQTTQENVTSPQEQQSCSNCLQRHGDLQVTGKGTDPLPVYNVLLLKNWCFWTVVLEKTLESLVNCKEIQPVKPKTNQSWIFIGRTDAEAETPILWPPDAKSWLIGKDPDAGKDWRWDNKGTKENEMVRWHYQLYGQEFE